MVSLVGVVLAFSARLLMTVNDVNRDRAFYPTVKIVIASYAVAELLSGLRCRRRCLPWVAPVAFEAACVDDLTRT